MLQLWDMKIPLLPKGQEVTACCNVSVLAPTKIPAMSETLITACVSAATPASPMPTDYYGVLMPNPSCDIIVAHSLSEVQNGTTVVQILNPSRDDVELHQVKTWVSFIQFHLLTLYQRKDRVCNLPRA